METEYNFDEEIAELNNQEPQQEIQEPTQELTQEPIQTETLIDENDFSEELNELEYEEKNIVAQNNQFAEGQNPKDAAETINISNKHNLNKDIVHANKKEVKYELKDNTFDVDALFEQNPKVASYLNDKYNAILSRDEIEGLTHLDDSLSKIKSNTLKKGGTGSFFGDIFQSIDSSLYGGESAEYGDMMAKDFIMTNISGTKYNTASVETIIEKAALSNKRQQELNANDPDYAIIAQATMSKEFNDASRAYSELKKSVKEGNIDSILSDTGSVLNESLDLFTQAWEHKAGLTYVGSKSSNSGFVAIGANLKGTAIGTGIAVLTMQPWVVDVVKTLTMIKAQAEHEAGIRFWAEMGKKYDITTPEGIRAGLNDKKFMDRITPRMYKKGITTGAVATLTTLGAAKLYSKVFKSASGINKASTIGGRVAKAGAVVGKTVAVKAGETIGEGWSEFAGLYVMEHGDMSKISGEEIFNEMLYSMFNGTAMIMGATSFAWNKSQEILAKRNKALYDKLMKETEEGLVDKIADLDSKENDLGADEEGNLPDDAGRVNTEEQKESKPEIDPKNNIQTDPVDARLAYPENPEQASVLIAKDIQKAKVAINEQSTFTRIFDLAQNGDLKDTQEVEGKLEEFANDEDSSVFFDTKDFEETINEAGLEVSEVLETLSPKANELYNKALEQGINFEVPMGDLVEKLASKKEFTPLLKVIRATKEGMTLKEGAKFIKGAGNLIGTVAAESKRYSKTKNTNKKNAGKIRKSIQAGLQLNGMNKTQSEYHSHIFSSIIERGADVLDVDVAEFYKGFDLSFKEKKLTKPTKARLAERLKLQEDTKLADNLEISERVAKKILKSKVITKEVINEAIEQDAKDEVTVVKHVKESKKKNKKFGKQKSPSLHSKIENAEARQLADDMLDGMTEQFIAEVETAIKGSRKFEMVDGKQKLMPSDSTFPKDYRLMKGRRTQETFIAAVKEFKDTGKKNTIYKNIEKRAAARLIEGWDAGEEHVAPNNMYRTTLGMPALNEQREVLKDDFDLFDDEGIPLGLTSIKGKNFMVDVFESGNTKTMLHETGHVWLEVTRIVTEKVAALDQENLTLKQTRHNEEVSAMLEYLGVDSFDKIEKRHHEKFAKTAESFFVTGNAPNAALARTFNRFAKWLGKLFKSLRDDQVIKMTPKIEQFMGALLASEQEIAKADIQLSAADTYQLAIAGSDALTVRHEIAILDAKAQAEIGMRASIFESLKAEASKEEKKATIIERGNIEEEYNNDVRYEAVDMLRSLPKGQKLSKNFLIKHYGADILAQLPTGIYTVEGGMDTDTFVELSEGFETGDQLIDSLIGLEEKSKAIEETLEARMNDKFPNILQRDADLEGVAQLELMTEKKEKVADLELQILAAKYPKEFKEVLKALNKKVKITPEDRARIKAEVGKLKVDELTPNEFILIKERSAKAKVAAFIRADFTAMIEESFNERDALIKAREVKKARAYKDKSLKFFDKKITKYDVKNKAHVKAKEAHLMYVAKQVLAERGYGNLNIDEAADYLNALAEQDLSPAKATEATGLKAEIDAAIGTKEQNYKKLTYEQFYEMAEYLRATEEQAKEARKFFLNEEQYDMDQLVNSASADVDSNLDRDETPEQEIKREKRLKSESKKKWNFAWGSLKASKRRAEHYSTILGKTWHNVIFRNVSQAVDRYRIEASKFADKYDALVKDLNTGSKDLTKKFYAKELDFTFNKKSELIGLLLHVGNPDSMAKALGPLGWGKFEGDNFKASAQWDAFFKNAQDRGDITKADIDFIQNVWNLIAELKPEAQKTHYKLNGSLFKEVETHKVKTKWGEIDGGYAPIAYDSYYSSIDRQREDINILNENKKDSTFASTGAKHTITRVDAKDMPSKIIKMDANLFMGHMESVLRYTYMQPAIQQTARFLNDKRIMAKLDQYDKYAMNDIFMPWLNRAASQRVEKMSEHGVASVMNKVATYGRSVVGKAIMTLNLANGFEQKTGLIIAGALVKPTHLLNAEAKYWASMNKAGLGSNKLADKVKELSMMMRERSGSQMVGIATNTRQILLTKNAFTSTKAFADNHAYVVQEIVQGQVDVVTWWAAYDQAKSKNPAITEADAIWEADSIVRQTQGSFNAEDISNIEAGSGMQRLFTMFYSYFNMQDNLVHSQSKIAKRDLDGLSKYGKLAYLQGMVLITPFLVSQALRAALSGKIFDEEDEEEERSIGVRAAKAGVYVMAGAHGSRNPFAGAIIQAGANLFDDKAWNDTGARFSPVTSFGEDAAGVITELIKLGGEEDFEDNMEKVNDIKLVKGLLAFISLSGVPATVFKKPYTYQRKVDQEIIEPKNEFDHLRGLLIGH